jgi:hypothetical protein
VGAFAWDWYRDREAATPQRDRPPASPAILAADTDLLGLVRAVETIPSVEQCRLAEVFSRDPLIIQAFCSTDRGDELRISHWEDGYSREESVAEFCNFIPHEGGFHPQQGSWSLAQVDDSGDSIEPGLTNRLERVLGVERTVCPS